jgi:hypothetical protein
MSEIEIQYLKEKIELLKDVIKDKNMVIEWQREIIKEFIYPKIEVK